MIPELGQFVLILALLVAAVQAFVPLVGAQTGRARWIALARPAALLQFALVGLAFALLTQAFVVQDFSVAYVARNSNSELPLLYRYSAVWGAHEGSLLLWALMLSLWTALVALRTRDLPEAFIARVLSVCSDSSRSASCCSRSSPRTRSCATCRPGPRATTSTRCCRTRD